MISDNRGTDKQISQKLSLSQSGTSEKGEKGIVNATFDATRRRRDESSLISTLEAAGKDETPTRQHRRKDKRRSKYRKKDIFTHE